MHINFCRKFVTFIILSALIPTIGLAAPRAMLEKAQTYALDSQVRAFQVPTVDSTGKIKYYDMTIKLTVKNDGSLNPIANVTARQSPSIRTGVLVPGVYKTASGSLSCKLTNIPLTNGRIQSFFTCKDTGNNYSELSVVTGLVATGHPYFSELSSFGVSKRSDVNTQTWGITTNSTLYLSDGCYGNVNIPISAKTDGSSLILSIYSTSAPSIFNCSSTLIKQP